MITRSIAFAFLALCPTSALAQYWQAPTYYYTPAYYSWPSYDNCFDCSTECSPSCVADDCQCTSDTSYKCVPCIKNSFETQLNPGYGPDEKDPPAGSGLNQFHAFSRGDEIFAVNMQTGWMFRYDADSQSWKGFKHIPASFMKEDGLPEEKP